MAWGLTEDAIIKEIDNAGLKDGNVSVESIRNAIVNVVRENNRKIDEQLMEKIVKLLQQ